jgi:hypothetical protein
VRGSIAVPLLSTPTRHGAAVPRLVRLRGGACPELKNTPTQLRLRVWFFFFPGIRYIYIPRHPPPLRFFFSSLLPVTATKETDIDGGRRKGEGSTRSRLGSTHLRRRSGRDSEPPPAPPCAPLAGRTSYSLPDPRAGPVGPGTRAEARSRAGRLNNCWFGGRI